MGTRADFYIGFGEKAEWIGSIAWDGMPFFKPDLSDDYKGGIKEDLLGATTESAYRLAVAACIDSELHHGTPPELGWPWPWDTSHSTDYTYSFDNGKVWLSIFGQSWHIPKFTRSTDDHEYDCACDCSNVDEGQLGPEVVHPNLSFIRNMPPVGDPRSGIVTVPTAGLFDDDGKLCTGRLDAIPNANSEYKTALNCAVALKI